ncbi:acid phosphatase AphA [Aeromonas allosaccharophila]|uniref:acid phosphatase AphA n=1 Tax=Aeromonas allosaccharophila TaxID=656 RepID=UPI003D1A630C
MKHLSRPALLASLLAAALSLPALAGEAATVQPIPAGVTTVTLAQQAPIHWVSVEQIAKSLDGLPPMAVGFDIDDTLLFSSPGFYRGKQEFSPNDESYLKNPAFWEKMNNGWDAFSIPKEVGKALIAMHLKRGDHIYFVTGRSATKTETVSQTLQQTMSIPADQLNPVIFAGDQPGQNTKVQWLKEKQMKVFYGDADGDIKAAQEIGIRGIRLLRAANSSYRPLPLAGALGEEVIINSQF